MKEVFQTTKERLPGICKITSDFYQQPKKRGSYFFVKSPISHDKTWSLCLYPASNTFCDFAGGNRCGDSIGLISYLKGVDNWRALQMLREFYGLTDSKEQDRQEARRKIQLQQEQERKKRQRQQAFKTALFACIDDLKRWEDGYTLALEKRLYEPFSDMWCFIMDELQRTKCKLDILCGSDQHSYRFMKRGSKYSSDRPQWLLDVLEMLAECGSFQATQSELAEIKAQRDFELIKEPGAERRCSIEW